MMWSVAVLTSAVRLAPVKHVAPGGTRPSSLISSPESAWWHRSRFDTVMSLVIRSVRQLFLQRLKNRQFLSALPACTTHASR
jgi:hypothetical protein